MGKEEKLYAIGLKGWVEIRKAKEVPKARITQAKIQGEKSVYVSWRDWANAGGTYADYTGWKTVPCTTTLKVTHFVGGRRLKVVSKRRFSQFVGLSPKVGELLEIPPELASISVLDKVMEGG